MRLLFSLIGYVCVATVITVAASYGYLRHTGRLDDEKLFRVAALLHDVDLEEIRQAEGAVELETPAEEMSFEQQQKQLRVATLQFDAKKKELADSLEAFDYRFSQLNEATDRYNRLSKKVDAFLNSEKAKVMDEALQEVRAQLQILIPKKQAKPILTRMIDDGQIDEVIQLMGSLPPRNRESILKTFETEQELEMLYRLTQRMLSGDPAKQYFDDQIDELQKLQSQDN